jgi:hypothetical protein
MGILVETKEDKVAEGGKMDGMKDCWQQDAGQTGYSQDWRASSTWLGIAGDHVTIYGQQTRGCIQTTAGFK